MATMTDDYITLDEAAKLLDLAPRTIRLYIARGMLQGYKRATAKGVQFVRRSDVQRLKEIVPVDRPSQPGDGE